MDIDIANTLNTKENNRLSKVLQNAAIPLDWKIVYANNQPAVVQTPTPNTFVPIPSLIGDRPRSPGRVRISNSLQKSKWASPETNVPSSTISNAAASTFGMFHS